MIKKDFYCTRFDGIELFRTYSDENLKIRQTETDILYDEAVDIESANWTYTESDIPIEDLYEEDETPKKAAAWDELTGGISNE